MAPGLLSRNSGLICSIGPRFGISTQLINPLTDKRTHTHTKLNRTQTHKKCLLHKFISPPPRKIKKDGQWYKPTKSQRDKNLLCTYFIELWAMNIECRIQSLKGLLPLPFLSATPPPPLLLPPSSSHSTWLLSSSLPLFLLSKILLMGGAGGGSFAWKGKGVCFKG